MKWFLDTEFNDHGGQGGPIELISIALVSEKGHEYYAVSSEFDVRACGTWLRDNVLAQLPPKKTWKKRSRIAREIKDLVLKHGQPEFWGYFCSYDWVALCQLYGRMLDVPLGFPHVCFDVMQAAALLGVDKADFPENENRHSALSDARWTRAVFEYLVEIEDKALADLQRTAEKPQPWEKVRKRLVGLRDE